MESTAKTLLIRRHLQERPAPVVVIEVKVVRECNAMVRHHRGGIVLGVTEKGGVADRGRWGGRQSGGRAERPLLSAMLGD